jgi:poly-gamma-glutamate capsule biosynthesis protein CapA/YwtB (metallophosphatase superfamily)
MPRQSVLFRSLPMLALMALFFSPQSVTLASSVLALEGLVLDVEGQPIQGVQVSSGEGETITGPTGFFKLTTQSHLLHTQLTFKHPSLYSMVHDFSLPARGAMVRDTFSVQPVILVRKKPGRVLLAFGGDTMMARRYLKPLPGEPKVIDEAKPLADMKSVLKFVRPYLSLADVASVNLETQLADKNPPHALPKSVTFYTSTAILDALKWGGVDYVALGNNHTFDYRGAGLLSTLDALASSNLGHSGAGQNERAARKPYVTTHNEVPISFSSYVGWAGDFQPNQVATRDKGGAALATSDSVREDILAVSEGESSVVQIHTGLEYHDHPTMNQRTLFREAIDAGADLVLGHHPHVLQGFDLHNDKLIGYSLGNFAFDQYIYSTQLGCLLYVWMDGENFHRAEIVPIYLNGYIPTPGFGEQAYDILQRIPRISNSVDLEFLQTGAHLLVNKRAREIRYESLVLPEIAPKSLVHLADLGILPQQMFDKVGEHQRPLRLGVDLLKRGTFESYGDRQTTDRTWLFGGDVTVIGKENKKLRIKGAATSGMRTFERAFSTDNPATFAADVMSSGDVELIVKLQRRTMKASWSEALVSGPVTELGRFALSAGERQVVIDFVTPRKPTKGVRLLIEVKQESGEVVEIDNLSFVEWHTPWLMPRAQIDNAYELQRTHVQVR